MKGAPDAGASAKLAFLSMVPRSPCECSWAVLCRQQQRRYPCPVSPRQPETAGKVSAHAADRWSTAVSARARLFLIL